MKTSLSKKQKTRRMKAMQLLQDQTKPRFGEKLNNETNIGEKWFTHIPICSNHYSISLIPPLCNALSSCIAMRS